MAVIFEELETALANGGAGPLLDRLTAELRARKDYHGLFYAMILAKRIELGLPAVNPPGRSENLPEAVQAPYEEAIRAAARTVGRLYLDAGDIAGAWPLYRMIQEPGPVAEALEKADPEDGEEVQRILEIALHEGAHPTRGFDLLLNRYGICTAITTLGQAFPQKEEVRDHCVRSLVRALHRELVERLKADVQGREGSAPATDHVPELLAGRDWLTGEDFAHVDVSHLGAVVQFATYLPPGPELDLAIELCAYGQKLPARLQGGNEPPFEDNYHDFGIYLETLAGRNAEDGIAHFRAKAERANVAEGETGPGEVVVNLLVKLKRYPEAVQAFSRYLAQADARQLHCPSLQELCQLAGDYRPLVEVSLRRGDLVNFAAGLIQSAGRK
jgi:hypothetical protein